MHLPCLNSKYDILYIRTLEKDTAWVLYSACCSRFCVPHVFIHSPRQPCWRATVSSGNACNFCHLEHPDKLAKLDKKQRMLLQKLVKNTWPTRHDVCMYSLLFGETSFSGHCRDLEHYPLHHRFIPQSCLSHHPLVEHLHAFAVFQDPRQSMATALQAARAQIEHSMSYDFNLSKCQVLHKDQSYT